MDINEVLEMGKELTAVNEEIELRETSVDNISDKIKLLMLDIQDCLLDNKQSARVGFESIDIYGDIMEIDFGDSVAQLSFKVVE